MFVDSKLMFVGPIRSDLAWFCQAGSRQQAPWQFFLHHLVSMRAPQAMLAMC